MSRDKQIEEMAKDLENHTCMSQFQAEIASRVLYTAGYRKASEVAEEIFADIEKYNRPPLPECEPIYIIKSSEFAELKKKYMEGWE